MTVMISPARPVVVERVDTRSLPPHPNRVRRRRLREQDRRSAHLGELHAMAELLDRAAVVLEAGWAQGVWHRPIARPAVDSATATTWHVDVPTGSGPGVCLVGAIVRAAGGRRAVPTQLLQRTLDLTWHTLRRRPDEPVEWCPGPAARALQLRDLTRWNDHPARRRDDVTGLLCAAGQRVARVSRG